MTRETVQENVVICGILEHLLRDLVASEMRLALLGFLFLAHASFPTANKIDPVNGAELRAVNKGMHAHLIHVSVAMTLAFLTASMGSLVINTFVPDSCSSTIRVNTRWTRRQRETQHGRSGSLERTFARRLVSSTTSASGSYPIGVAIWMFAPKQNTFG